MTSFLLDEMRRYNVERVAADLAEGCRSWTIRVEGDDVLVERDNHRREAHGVTVLRCRDAFDEGDMPTERAMSHIATHLREHARLDARDEAVRRVCGSTEDSPAWSLAIHPLARHACILGRVDPTTPGWIHSRRTDRGCERIKVDGVGTSHVDTRVNGTRLLIATGLASGLICRETRVSTRIAVPGRLPDTALALSTGRRLHEVLDMGAAAPRGEGTLVVRAANVTELVRRPTGAVGEDAVSFDLEPHLEPLADAPPGVDAWWLRERMPARCRTLSPGREEVEYG